MNRPRGSLTILMLVLLCLPASRAFPQAPRWETAYDFVANLGAPGVENPSGATATSASPGGRTMPALSQHPDAPGRPLVRVTFPAIALPALRPRERLTLRFAIGIREGFSRAQNPTVDGCGFIVQVNGREVYHRPYVEQQWREESLDLSRFTGQKITVTFLTDPLSNSAYDWAVWGNPQILIVGRKAKAREIPKVPFLRLASLQRQPVASRILDSSEDAAAVTVTAVLDRQLDLAAALRDTAGQAGAPPVPLAPEMAVGEGEDPQNHTLVRVLNRWGIMEAQFLAYPPEVRGGVAVHGATLPGEGRCLLAAPLADANAREIRLFNRRGGLLRAFTPEQDLTPPFVIAVGDFLPGHAGDEIAVTSRQRKARGAWIGLYDGRGRRLKRLDLPDAAADTLTLAAQPAAPTDRLIIYHQQARRALLLDAAGGQAEIRDLPGLEAGRALYPSAFGAGALLATGPEPAFSTVTRIPPAGDPSVVDVGARENRFWATWYADAWESVPEGKYMRRARFLHLRTDGSSPAAADPALAADAAQMAGAAFLKGFETLLRGYATDLPAVWEPCFSHRWHKGRFQKWRDAKDPATGLPQYVALTRNNHPVEYGEFGTVDFYAGTYAFGLPALDNLYVLPLRAFLRRFAPEFRRAPEQMVCLEPNHEHETAVEAEGTMGDYNPRMIEGFYRYLTGLYGSDPAGLNRALGTPFRDYFDAPRQWERGAWDAYSAANPFYREWLAYNRYVINRRLAQTFREALLAGFPPESIKCHQIPDTYAIGRLDAFSAVTARFTPIDYALNAGTGYGFTRYGVWYRQAHDALQDAHAAGFDMMSIGEYQALTPDREAAYGQLRFLVENGCMFAHCMLWPAAHDRGFNATMDYALRRLFAEDRPKADVTGGVGQARPVIRGNRRFDIVCIGTGPAHTGLLKSVREDGGWEGSVYVVPFHAHVTVQTLPPQGSLRNGRGAIAVGPLRGLDSGEQIEIAFRARAGAPGRLLVRVLRGDRELPGLRHAVRVERRARSYRYVLRVPLPVEDLRIILSAPEAKAGVTLESLTALRQTEQTPKLTKGRLAGQRHRGGVTFDLL